MFVRAACLACVTLLVATDIAAAAPPQRRARPAAARPTPPPGSLPAWGRTFGSNFGPITVHKIDPAGFRATYTYHDGRAEGDLQGTTVTGYWTQSVGGHPCETARDGRRDWGRFRMDFAADGRSFRGFTGYCDDNPDMPWDSK